MSFLFIIFIINIIFSFFFALYVYKQCQCQYKPCIKKNEKGEIIDLNKLYDLWSSKDSQNFFQLWFEGTFTILLKLSISVLIAIIMIITLNLISLIFRNTNTNEKQYKILKKIISFYSRIFLYVNGIKVNNKKVNCEKIYKKYLGEDYDFKNNDYSLIISNHTGFFDVVICMMLFSGGFISTKEVGDYYLVGKIAKGIHCFFIDRSSENERKKILVQLEERQKAFFNKKIFAPLIIFPEGTTTCGRNILKFKKGAFYSLLPIKPVFINIYQESNYHLSTGIISVVLVYFRNLCHTVESMYYIDMPVIRPTKFMFDNYGHLGKEKWEVYAEVTRKIYCELGNLKESNYGKRDNEAYLKEIFKNKL